MSVIKGEKVVEVVTLTAKRELLFRENWGYSSSLLEEERQKAYARGEESGITMGYEKALQELKGLWDLLQTLTNKLLEQKKRLLDQLKPEIVEFSMAVCEKVIRRELSHPEGMVRLIQSLLKTSALEAEGGKLEIFLAPEDLHMLERDLTAFSEQTSTVVKFASDPLIRRGDCRIECPHALLNYSISRELAHLSAKVLQR